MQRSRGPRAPARLADRQSGGLGPLFPLDVGEAARHCAMAGQPDGDRHVSVVAVAPRDVPQAVRRIRQSVEQDHGAGGSAGGLHDVRAVPVLREIARVDRAAGEIAVGGIAGLGIELVRHLRAHLVEDPLLRGDVLVPIRLGDLCGRQLVRDVGVPEFQRGAALRVVGPQDEHRQQHDAQHDRAPLDQLDRFGFHCLDPGVQRGGRSGSDRSAAAEVGGASGPLRPTARSGCGRVCARRIGSGKSPRRAGARSIGRMVGADGKIERRPQE